MEAVAEAAVPFLRSPQSRLIAFVDCRQPYPGYSARLCPALPLCNGSTFLKSIVNSKLAQLWQYFLHAFLSSIQ